MKHTKRLVKSLNLYNIYIYIYIYIVSTCNNNNNRTLFDVIDLFLYATFLQICSDEEINSSTVHIELPDGEYIFILFSNFHFWVNCSFI